MDSPIFVSTRHVDAPWIAADLAVLNEAAVDVGLDVDLQLLAAKRTRDQELVRHLRHACCSCDAPFKLKGYFVGAGLVPRLFAATTSVQFA